MGEMLQILMSCLNFNGYQHIFLNTQRSNVFYPTNMEQKRTPNQCQLSEIKIFIDDQGPIPETIRSLWKSDRITNFLSAHDFTIRSDSTNDPVAIGSWSWRTCWLLGSVLDKKFHHNNWSFYQ